MVVQEISYTLPLCGHQERNEKLNEQENVV